MLTLLAGHPRRLLSGDSLAVQATRTTLAFTTIATLLATPDRALFHATVSSPPSPSCLGVAEHSLLCRAGLGNGRFLSVAISLVVAVGLLPRASALAQWWVLWSLSTSGRVTDGGDQIAANLALLLIPILLCRPDLGRWRHARGDSFPDRRALAVPWILLVVLQISGVYLHSAVAKFGVG